MGPTLWRVGAANLAYALDAMIVVQRGATNAASGTALATAVTAAAALAPGGAAVSATNPAFVVIPAGTYDITGLTIAPADGVRLVEQSPGSVRITGGTDTDKATARKQLTLFQPVWWGCDPAQAGSRALWVISDMAGGRKSNRWLVQNLRDKNLNVDLTAKYAYRYYGAYSAKFKTGVYYDAIKTATGHYGLVEDVSGGWGTIQQFGGYGMSFLYTVTNAKTIKLNLPTGTTKLYLLFKSAAAVTTVDTSLEGDTGNGTVTYGATLQVSGAGCLWHAKTATPSIWEPTTDYFKPVATWTGAGSAAGAKFVMTTNSTNATYFLGGIAVTDTDSTPAAGVIDPESVRKLMPAGGNQGALLGLGTTAANGRYWNYGHNTGYNGITDDETTFAAALLKDYDESACVPTDDNRYDATTYRFQITEVGTIAVEAAATGSSEFIGSFKETWSFNIYGGHTCWFEPTFNAAAASAGWKLLGFDTSGVQYEGGKLNLTEVVAGVTGDWYQIPEAFGPRKIELYSYTPSQVNTAPVQASSMVLGGAGGEILVQVHSSLGPVKQNVTWIAGTSLLHKAYAGMGIDANVRADDLALTDGYTLQAMTHRQFGEPGSFQAGGEHAIGQV